MNKSYTLTLAIVVPTCIVTGVLALLHELGDDLGLCKHLIIALADVGRGVGAHARHMTLGHGIALVPCAAGSTGSMWRLSSGHN